MAIKNKNCLWVVQCPMRWKAQISTIFRHKNYTTEIQYLQMITCPQGVSLTSLYGKLSRHLLGTVLTIQKWFWISCLRDMDILKIFDLGISSFVWRKIITQTRVCHIEVIWKLVRRVEGLNVRISKPAGRPASNRPSRFFTHTVSDEVYFV